MPRSSPSARTGRPPATSRAAISEAALRLIDRDGWEKLTIRRLAADLGIGATTLYHHVRDREDLLILLLNEQGSRMSRPELPADSRDRIVVAATTMHGFLTEWPWAAEVLTTDGFIGRLDGSTLWMVEVILDGAIDCGCDQAQAVDLFRNLWYYTVGEILVRAHSRQRLKDDPATQEEFFGSVDLTELPRLAEVGNQWPQLTPRDIYPTGLEAFIDGMLAKAARR